MESTSNAIITLSPLPLTALLESQSLLMTSRVNTPPIFSSPLKPSTLIATESFLSLFVLIGDTLNGQKLLSPSSLKQHLKLKLDIISSILLHFRPAIQERQLLLSSHSSAKTFQETLQSLS